MKALTSYKWLDTKEPTIIVPGKTTSRMFVFGILTANLGLPAEWSPPDREPWIQADAGSTVLDYNIYNFPSSPMEPAIHAITHLHPNFDFSGVDLITDKQPLAMLLHLAQSNTHQSKERLGSAEFHAEVVGKTIIFIRGDGKPYLHDEGGFNGFRKNFNKRFFSYPKGFEDFKGHYHLTSYNLGDIKIVVRHSVDGYIVSADEHPAVEVPEVRSYTTASGLQIQSGGLLLPPSHIADVNTFKDKYKANNRRASKQREAWVSRSGHFITAQWQDVTPDRTSRTDRSEMRAIFPKAKIEVEQYEEPAEHVLEMYHDLLKATIETVAKAEIQGEGSTYTITVADGYDEPVVSQCISMPVLTSDVRDRILNTA